MIKALFKAIFFLEEWDLPKKAVNWVLYDSDNMPVGFCSAYKLAYENAGFFALSGILPMYRGKGYHKKLIRVRIQWAKRNGYDYAITYTEKNNDKSFENLQDCGFKLYIPENKWVGDDFLYWRKQL